MTKKEPKQHEWIFQNPNEIIQIISQEQKIPTSSKLQYKIVLKKVNNAMMYFILTECTDYQIIIKRRGVKTFLDIIKIMKGNEKIYDSFLYQNDENDENVQKIQKVENKKMKQSKNSK